MDQAGRVALVDGSDDATRHADGLREASGFEVHTYATVAAALDAVAAGDVDCIVARHDLPDGTGLDLLRDLRETHPDLPFILFTKLDVGDLIVEALRADVTDVVPQDAPNVYGLLAERVSDALEAERAKVAAVDIERVASVVRNINRTLLWARTRESLLWRTCRILSKSDPYVFAWVGLTDEATGRLEPAAWGGVGEDYLGEITVTTDESPTGQGPAGDAFRTGDISVVTDVTTDPDFVPWREQAERYGFSSVASIPLTYEDDVLGVLSVYTDRPFAFDDAERSMLDEVGGDVGYALHALDIRDELERHAELVEHAPIGIFTTEPGETGVLLEANPALARIMDARSVADLVGRRVDEFYVDPDQRHAIIDRLQVDQEATETIPLRTLTGREITAQVTLVRVNRPDGTSQIMGALKDVTKRVSLERDLVEEREFVEQLLDISPVGIVVFDGDGVIERANAHAERILGVDRDHLVGRRYDDPEWDLFDEDGSTFPPDDLPFARVLNAKRPIAGLELGIRFQGGEERWLSVNAVPVLDAGEVQRVVTAVDDITAHREHTAALEWERDRFRAVFEDAFDAMVLTDDDGRYTAANPAAADLFGVSREKLLGQTISDFATEDFDFEAAWTDFQAARAERGIFELERPSGEHRTVEYSATSDIVPGQHLSILRDITERLEYETELREQNRRLEAILTNAPVVLFAFDEDGRYTFVAGQGMAETGIDADTLVGETFRDQFSDQATALDMMERALAGEDVHGDIRVGGREFEVWARPAGNLDEFDETLAVDHNGDALPGTPAVIGVAMDVTDSRLAEAEVHARQDQIAFFNSLLRHEVLNGLAVVLGNADTLREELPADSELAPHVERIHSRSKDIVEAVRRIRTVLTKLAVADPELTVQDLAATTRDRVEQARSDYPQASVTLDTPESAPVYADDLLGDVVYNVVSNAIQHNDADTPTVDVTVTPDTGTTTLVVEDNGPGIPERVIDLLFGEPDAGEERSWATAGSFGLYFVTTMVDRYGGAIDVSARDPRGTRIEIRLPTAPTG